jgi:D-alanine-D-alanine ligase
MKIVVLFGGNSAERDVSIASGAQVVRALREAGHEALPVDTTSGVLSPIEEDKWLKTIISERPPSPNCLPPMDLRRVLRDDRRVAECDVVFLALHGGSGENGTVQACLDSMGIRYTGSGMLGSAMAMDKEISKRMFCALGVPTPDWLMAPTSEREIIEKLGLPVVVKASKQGSSVGLHIVRQSQDLQPAIEESLRHDDEVIVEKFVPGRELTVGILENRALAVGEIVPKRSEVFDYASKYQPGGAEENFPAPVDQSTTERVRDLGLLAHRALKLRDYSRVDFRLDPDGRLWCLEANTLPGMTSASLLPKSAAAAGFAFPKLCERICELALRRPR